MDSIKIDSPYNNLISLKCTPGHFSTSSSHINYFVDLTTLKSRASSAKAVAKAIASEYLVSTVVDTIICMDSTNVIGAYLADELTSSGFMCMNAHGTIYIITPGQTSTGLLHFTDNEIPMIRGKHVLLLVATASTGNTVDKAMECIEYYGGEVMGVSAIFSAATEISGHKINAVFHDTDIEGYASYPSRECPLCAQKQKLDGIITAGGGLANL